MKRILILVLLFLALLAGSLNRRRLLPTDQKALAEPRAGGGSAATVAAAPPARVDVTRAVTLQWRPYLETVGTITAVNGVTVSTDLGGRIVEVNFESGSEVRTGALLVQIDVEVEKAQLAQAEAKRDLSRLNLERSRTLLDRHTISQSEYDAAEADLRQNQGAVEEVRAIIDKKTIHARFDGTAGIRQVNVGQYLNPGQPIVTLQSVDPVYVDFQLPQEQLSRIETGRSVELQLEAYPEVFQGTVTAINSEVDQDSRYIKVRATVPNPQRKLRPGMFATVSVQTGAARDVVAVPMNAIRYAPYGDSVFVVARRADERGKPQLILEQHFVKLGQTRGNLVAVVSGLPAGAEVVTGEVFRMRNGAAVTVNDPGTAGGNGDVTGPPAPSHS
ncbi:MAG: efflux RND transporter periplasmic adaptor subunit [Verrucomicrobia bacterium]|nr:efflux RND transporter periplasmic adaptor subunit [Verrucomicrobiota bacterium]